MNYELQFFDAKLKDTSDLLLLSDAHLFPEKFSIWKHAIKIETERIKSEITKNVFGISKEKIVERYIQHHQSKIIFLSDLAFKREFENLPIELTNYNLHTDLVEKYFDSVYNYLVELLSFIEKHFSKYFDQDSTIPDAYRNFMKADLKQLVVDIKTNLSDKKIPEHLIDLMTHPLSSFFAGNQTASFRSLLYIKAYMAELNELVNSNIRGLQFEKETIRISFYLNFNSYKSYSFICKKITSHYLAKSSLSKQIECLMIFSKAVYHSPEKPGLIYNHSRISLKTYILDWIQSEINFLKSKHQLSLNFPDTLAKENIGSQNLKVPVNLSVAQLAFSIKALVDCNVIKTTNTSELLRFFAQNFSTPYSEYISDESLRNKYYNAERGTIQSMEKILKQLMAYSKDKG